MLQDDETVTRAALLPRMVISGVISPAKAVADLRGEYRSDGSKYYTLSLGSGKMLPTHESRHDYGCRVAVRTNAANRTKADETGANFERTFYRGYYLMSVGAIHCASTDIFTLEVHLHPLPGLPEHCDIEMSRTPFEATKGKVSTERTLIIARLRSMLHDPQEHICADDADHSELVGSIRLVANDVGPILGRLA
jgi:hypothetical protein